VKDWATRLQEDPVHLLGQYRSWSQAVYRLYLASYGVMPRYADFVPDVELIGRGVMAGSLDDQDQKLADKFNQLAEHWVERATFKARYNAMTNERFIDALAGNARLSLAPAERAAFVRELNSGALTRAQALLAIVNNGEFAQKEEKRSLVLLHYFGYLRRDPDHAPDGSLAGFNFWLREVEMSGEIDRLSRAFTASIEYAERTKK
jgi:uncharacterized protein DUF4214